MRTKKRPSPSSRASATTFPSCPSSAPIGSSISRVSTTDGEENVAPNALEAFVFTERGVYRPGDEVHIGYIVKQRDWAGRLAGLPLEIEVLDARGLCALKRRVSLPAAGFDELKFSTAYQSPTGEYRINLYLVRNGWRDLLLGGAGFQVKEFLPDRMRLTSELNKQTARGWIDPKGVQALVRLENLYGTAASDRRITSQMELSPAGFHFDEFSDYVFFDPLREDKKEREPQTVDLGETKTDADGKATVRLDLERFADATYEMSLWNQGFEAEGGRSVSAYNNVLVSALPHVVGYKANPQLNFLAKDRPAAIDFIALDPQLHKIALDGLRFELIERTYVSILTKKENGDYAYESVLRETPVKSETAHDPRRRFALSPNDGATRQLPSPRPRREWPTGQPGLFLRRRAGQRHALAGEKCRAAGETRPPAIQRRRRDRGQHHRALHRRRLDHDRERQGARAAMVQEQHHEQRAAHSRPGRFRRHRLRQCLLRPRARFARRFS